MSKIVVNTVESIDPLTTPLDLKGLSVTFNGGAQQIATTDDVDNAVAAATLGLLDDRGNYDASSNLYPATGGSGTAGAIVKGDLWYVSVPGTLGGVLHAVGYSIRALVDSPGQTSTNWASSNVGLGYAPENSGNKQNSFSAPGNSTDFPTTQAVVDYAETYVPAYVASNGAPVGSFLDHGGKTAPTGYVTCNRQILSRTTYSALFAVRCAVLGTPTLTIATPCVVTLTSHGLVAGEGFFFQTTGALPTGVSVETQYFVLASGLTANDFQFATTPGGAAINTTGSQSGVHTLRWCPDGIPDASNFYAPDIRGISRVGAGTNATMTRANGTFFDGGAVGANRNDQLQGHIHSMGTFYAFSGFGGGSPAGTSPAGAFNPYTGGPESDGSNGAPRIGNETRPAQQAVLVCIKY